MLISKTVSMPDQKSIEKVPVKIFGNSDDASTFVAKEIAALIRDRESVGKSCLLGFATGSTPTRLYD